MHTISRKNQKLKGMTLVEVSLTVALILSLVIILVIGTRAYIRGSNTATCMAQQQRLLKQGIGSMMNEIATIDAYGTEMQRYKTICNFYEALNNTIGANEVQCPSAIGPSNEEILMYNFGTSDPATIESWYGEPLDQLLTEWFGSTEQAYESMSQGMASYSIGYTISWMGNIDANYLKDYHVLYTSLGKTAYLYIACPKTWNSYGTNNTASARMEYHGTW